MFRRYHVGTMDLWGWKGCCIFWQIDKEFVCRTGKIMDFYIKTDSQGNEIDVKRVKEKDGDNERPHVMFITRCMQETSCLGNACSESIF